MATHNNWLHFSFDGKLNIARSSIDSVFDLHFTPTEVTSASYKDALYNNARAIRDSISGPLDVLLSGGIDSEVIVRVFKDLGIKHNTFIFQLENNLNVRDVIAAEMLCDELNIPYKIIDFNHRKFYETQAKDYFDKTFSPCSGRIARLAWFDMLDNTPVWGEGEPVWVKQLDHTWMTPFDERDFVYEVYGRNVGRSVVGQWWAYTPDIMIKFLDLSIVQQVLANRHDILPHHSGSQDFPLNISTWPIRDAIHRSIWPTIRVKPKLTGHEGPYGIPDHHVPRYMMEFAEQYTRRVNKGSWQYNQQQFRTLMHTNG
jgi:hypothetical protein